MDFIFDRGSPVLRVKLSVLNEVLTSSPRLALRAWIIFEGLQPSCPSIHLRRSCNKIDTTFGGAFLAHLRGCKIEGHLRQSSSCLRPGEAPVMIWHSFLLGLGARARLKCASKTSPPKLHSRTKNHLQQLQF